MMTLLSIVNEISNASLNNVVSENETKGITYEELCVRADLLRRQSSSLQNLPKAIIFDSLDNFIVQLLAYDGFCSEIYLCANSGTAPKRDLQPSDRVKKSSHPTIWWFATSGTTGKPKWIPHQLQGLLRGIKKNKHSRNAIWGLMYEPIRFAGMQVLLQALINGATIVSALDDVTSRVARIAAHKVSALSATPAMWRQILLTNRADTLPLRYVTLGGEIADQRILSQLTKVYPDARIQHIYASTEAGVGFAVTDGLAGFPANWLNDEQQPVQFKVADNGHLFVKAKEYMEPILHRVVDSGGFIDTEDLVEIKNDRVLFLGRASGVINVGGYKVVPESVEQVVMSVIGVEQARVYGKESSVMGQLVTADVTIAHNAERKKVHADIIKTCRESLKRHEIPMKINWVDSISLTSNGKIERLERALVNK